MRTSKFFFPLLLATLTFTFFSCSKPAKSEQKVEEATSSEEVDGHASPVAEDTSTPSDSTESTADVTPIAEWATAESLVMNCGGAMDLAQPVGVIAANITDDSLMYDVEPFSDCSGTFHRFLDSLALRCGDYQYPDKQGYRDSRNLGKWYQEQGTFVRVSDPLEMSSYIKPGAVMFYGPRKLSVDSLSVEALFQPGGINHVGVIVSVTKDDEGIVTGYSLFHGQRPGKMASTTNYHKRVYSNRPEYPAYGNGSEQWVGVAPIISE